MPATYADLIRAIDPNADVERVGDVADDLFRFFGEMTEDDWRVCIRMAGGDA